MHQCIYLPLCSEASGLQQLREVDNEDSKTVIRKAPYVKNTTCSALVLVGLKVLKPLSGKAIGWISDFQEKRKCPVCP